VAACGGGGGADDGTGIASTGAGGGYAATMPTLSSSVEGQKNRENGDE
jgi:hypothetical protein